MRTLLGLLVLSALAGPALAGATPPIRDPEAFVKAVYGKLAHDEKYSPPDDVYTPRLAAAWADMQHDAHGEVGRVDFVFWVNGQDWLVTNVIVKSLPVEGRADRRVVVATFENGKTPEEVHLYFERKGGRWLLDDARSLKSNRWTLSLLLRYGDDES